jgi:uncharacterized protein (TIGR02996 family)
MGRAEKLFEKVYEDPDDDAPRAALADYLTERGDPRGEFISLQLAEASGTATKPMLKRAAALLAKHEDSWLEPYGNPNGVRWARGFPARARPAVFRGLPRPWRTMRTLVVDNDTRYNFLSGPLVEHLRELIWDRWYPGSFAPFCKDARLPKLEILRWAGLDTWSNEASWQKGYEKLSKFKHLVELELEPALVGSKKWFWESKITKRLKRLVLAKDLASAPHVVARAAELPCLERLTLKDLAGDDHTFAATFTGEGLSCCEVTTDKKLDAKALAALLEKLAPTQLTSFQLVGLKTMPPAVKKALRRQRRLEKSP